MKNTVLLSFLLLSLIILVSCSSDDDEPVVPIEQEVEITVDFDALANLDGNDATALATFENGLSAAEFTTDAVIGDKINYTIKATSNVDVVCTDFLYESGDTELWNSGLRKIDNGQGFMLGFEVLEPATADQECKFNILFRVFRDGVLDPTEYVIDPKIRIRTTRN
ncbi:MAG: hypothetical protein HWE21_02775 [Cytophagia bacterium]|nr:hypothetical protein [Cytophagia bacterium]